MTESWTEAERLAAEVLASGSDETLRELLAELDRGPPPLDRSTPPTPSSRFRPWLDSDLLNSAADAVIVLVAVACVAAGARPLTTPIADARPVFTQALQGISLPAAAAPERKPFSAVAAIDQARSVTAGRGMPPVMTVSFMCQM